MNKMISDLVRAHKGKVVDKWSSYLNTYDTIFAPYKDKKVNILEIGIANGGSLDVWAEYFHNAKHIVGCDINPNCGSLKYDDERVSVVIGDANETETINKIKAISEQFDIIIDDGSHLNPDVIKTFALYYPLLNYNGLYIVEDLHTSYWTGWGGGLRLPLSSMSFFKRLADVPNYEHWRIKRKRKEYLKYFEQYYSVEFIEEELATIHSVMFVNSMAIINSKYADNNKLGKRIVRGNDEHIMPNMLKIDGTNISALHAEVVDDWQYDPIAMVQRINQLGAQNDNPV